MCGFGLDTSMLQTVKPWYLDAVGFLDRRNSRPRAKHAYGLPAAGAANKEHPENSINRQRPPDLSGISIPLSGA